MTWCLELNVSLPGFACSVWNSLYVGQQLQTDVLDRNKLSCRFLTFLWFLSLYCKSSPLLLLAHFILSTSFPSNILTFADLAINPFMAAHQYHTSPPIYALRLPYVDCIGREKTNAKRNILRKRLFRPLEVLMAFAWTYWNSHKKFYLVNYGFL